MLIIHESTPISWIIYLIILSCTSSNVLVKSFASRDEWKVAILYFDFTNWCKPREVFIVLKFDTGLTHSNTIAFITYKDFNNWKSKCLSSLKDVFISYVWCDSVEDSVIVQVPLNLHCFTLERVSSKKSLQVVDMAESHECISFVDVCCCISSDENFWYMAKLTHKASELLIFASEGKPPNKSVKSISCDSFVTSRHIL